jgi:DNA polymerase III epsilon subunit-like protein
MRLLIFDTETTGLPKTREPAIKGADNWPHLVSIAWVVVEGDMVVKSEYHIIKPNWEIPQDSVNIHGITYEKAMAEGEHLSDVILKFMEEPYDIMIAHNMNFDFNVLINAIMWDLKLTVYPDFKKRFCTMEGSRIIMKIPFANGRGYKSPKLVELYEFIVRKKPAPRSLHNSLYDAQLLAEIVMRSSVLRSMMGLPAVPAQINNAYQKGTTLFL